VVTHIPTPIARKLSRFLLFSFTWHSVHLVTLFTGVVRGGTDRRPGADSLCLTPLCRMASPLPIDGVLKDC
jgi:hypothetical protein